MNISEFLEDPEKQSAGTPIYISDAVFYVRRWGTPESLRVRKKLKMLLFGPLHKHTDEDDARLLAHWLAEYGVADWENLFDVDSQPVTYSVENARNLFTQEELWLSLNQELFVEATKYENYLFDQVDESADEIKKP